MMSLKKPRLSRAQQPENKILRNAATLRYVTNSRLFLILDSIVIDNIIKNNLRENLTYLFRNMFCVSAYEAYRSSLVVAFKG